MTNRKSIPITEGAKYWYEFPPEINTGTNADTEYRASLHFRPMKVNGATVSSFIGDVDWEAIFEEGMDKLKAAVAPGPNEEEARLILYFKTKQKKREI